MKLRSTVLTPLSDAYHGLDRCLDRGVPALLLVGLGLLAGWWLYVPLHELLHAFACLAAGGTVSELEISPLYGGALLARWIPWVTAGGEYAGRLSGFDTGGSDIVYLITDLGPYLLTLLPGVWWLRRAARARTPALYGASLPFALAPFAALTGDAYEIGAILVTRLPPWSAERALLRGDDLLLKVEQLAGAGATAWIGLLLAALLGLVWAFLTYAAAGRVARALGEPALEPRAAGGPPSGATAEAS